MPVTASVPSAGSMMTSVGGTSARSSGDRRASRPSRTTLLALPRSPSAMRCAAM